MALTQTDRRRPLHRNGAEVVRDGERPEDDASGSHARRRGWWPADRPTVWREHGGATLAELLDQLPSDVRRLYVTGPRPGGDAQGFYAWIAGGPPRGWEELDHYSHAARPVLRYRRPDGARVVVLRSASWWGETDAAADVQRDAAELLRRQLVRVFWSQLDGAATRGLLDTPATTGRALMLAAMPFGLDVPPLPDDVRDLIRRTTTQGRWQTFRAPHGREQLAEGVDAYDLRLAYAALCRELPGRFTGHHATGVDRLDSRAFLRGGPWQYQRCRVRIVGTVPDGWWGHGVVPQLVDGHEADQCDACQRTSSVGITSTCWPSLPGAPFNTWVDGCEAALAAEQGWTFSVVEALTFDRARPLDGWADKLARIRELLAEQWRRDPANREAVKLAAGGARMLLLQGVGAVHGSSTTVRGTTDEPSDVPDGAAVELLPDGTIAYAVEQRAQWSALDRPEWSSAVWARCRARIGWHAQQGSGVHTVDPSAVVAIRQDAVYLAGGTRVDHWSPDEGRVGWLRRVPGIEGPCSWPGDTVELLALTGGAA